MFINDFVLTQLPVVEGESYDGTFTLLAMTSFTGAHIRFWTARTKEDVVPDLTYVNFDQTTVQPDDCETINLLH